jgi:TIR domain/SIR2-like domain
LTVAESSIFWDTLIQLIEERKIVPVVGQDVLTITDAGGPKLLYAYLAEQLAKYVGVSAENLPPGAELNEVACRFLAQNNQAEDIYPALKAVASKAEGLPIPEALLQLADIGPLQLFVTTTFDSFLTRSLNQKRFGGNTRTRVFAHSPTEAQDLPGELKSLDFPVVYHLFGKLSSTPAYAVTQEDTVEFFHSLQSTTRQPPLLFDELNRQSLLILGSRFSGWLARFFMRMSKRQRLSVGGKSDYIVDPEVSSDDNQVLFLKNFSKATKIYRSGGVLEFVSELHQRWTERHPDNSTRANESSPSISSLSEVEPGAVFLSYASGDSEAVEKLKTALEAAGVDVFFDREQLQPGNDWEAKLRRNIHQCSLFLPIISRQTLTPDRRFFRVEWNLALEEAQKASFSDEEAFLLPVVIDDTRIDDPAIPAKFCATQWKSLPGGQPTPDFVTRVQQLYRKYQKLRVRT